MSVTIKSNSKATVNLKYAVRDNLLKSLATNSGNIDGVKVFSLDDLASYPLQNIPLSGTVLKDLASGDSDLVYNIINANGSVTWDSVKKAFDYSSVSTGLSGVQTPAGWLAAEFNGNNKHFILSAYVYIPTPDNWHAKSGGLVDFTGTVSSASTSTQKEVLGALAFIHHPTATSDQEFQIWARYSSADNADSEYQTLSMAFGASSADIPFGEFAQVSFVRTATENKIYLISSKGIRVTASSAKLTGKDVINSGSKITWGRGSAFGGLTNKYKLSRGFIINLNKHAIPDIQAFLKADWDRQVARGWIV